MKLFRFLIFVFVINPLVVIILLTICYQIFHIDTSRAAYSSDPLLPYVLIRVLLIPVFISPFVILLTVLRFFKTRI